MKEKWLNDGEPDENGYYVAVIESNSGVPVSTFKGKTIKEVADAVLHSQANANREISRLRRPDQGRTAPLKIEPRELQPADKLRLATDLGDPDRVVGAVREIVTAEMGASPRQIAERVSTVDQRDADSFYAQEAEAFVQATPGYYPVPQNQEKLFATLEANHFDLTRNNLAIVYQQLADRGEMIAWPNEGDESEEEEPAATNGARREAHPSPEPNPPSPTNTRPRSVSTGIRSSDASATPPPPRRPQVVTRADIERMPRAEYNERLRDPEFRRQVDAM